MVEENSKGSDQIQNSIVNDVIDTISKLSEAMGNQDIQINQQTKLFGDLGFTKTLLRELWKPLTRISNKYSGSRVTKSEAGKLETVADAIKLINSKIPNE
jgi:hypothetical protein